MDVKQSIPLEIIVVSLPGILALIGIIYQTIAHRRESNAKVNLDDASALDKTSDAYSKLVESHQRRIASLEASERDERERRKRLETELAQARRDINEKMQAHKDCEEALNRMSEQLSMLAERMEAVESRNAALQVENAELKQRVKHIENGGNGG